MNIDQLHEFLYYPTSGERWHLDHPGQLSPFYDKLQPIHDEGDTAYLFNFENTLKDEDFAVVKETRYTTIPMHFHKDMELNYIYEGSCTFVINHQLVTLHKGDVCILDSNVHHAAISEKSEHDIVINFVFKQSYFTNSFITRMSNKGVLTDFLLNAISRNQAHDQYLIFKTIENFKFHSVIQLLLCEYYAPDINYHELSKTYMTLLFMELINCIQTTKNETDVKRNHTIIDMLTYIEQHFVNCTLQDIGERFGFHPQYAGNLLKVKTGCTFQELKVRQQMSEAQALLANTSLSIQAVIREVGCSNDSYFYKKYKALYGMTPKQYRKELKRLSSK